MGILSGGPADGHHQPALHRRTEYVAVLENGPWVCPENPGAQDVPRLIQARGKWHIYERVDYSKPDRETTWRWSEGPLT